MTEKELNLIKKSISNIDLYFIAYELNNILQDGFINNIYELPGTDILRIKFRSKVGNKDVIIDPETRVNITQFKYPSEKFPSQFIMGLRKYMKGRRIERIYQYNFDRIIIIELKSSDGKPWKFVLELFGKGNFILVDGEGLTFFAKHYKKFRNRDLLAKRPYEFPGAFGTDIGEISKEKFLEITSDNEQELVRVLARKINVGGYVIEEICKRANIDKKLPSNSLNDEQIDTLLSKFSEFNSSLKNYEYSPRLLLNKDDDVVGFEPLEFQIYDEYKSDEKESFNETIDDFFSRFESEKLYGGEIKKSKTKLNKFEKILKQQVETIANLEVKKEKYQKIADLIYQDLYTIDNLIKTIMEQKKIHGRDWDEISKIIEKGKEQNVPESMIFDKILKKEIKVRLKLEDLKYKFDLNKNASDNAQELYKKSAKCRKKIKGAKVAIENTKKKIIQLQDSHAQIQEEKAVLIKEPKKKWYESFHWFISSDGFLVIGGRNASSNESIVKKHMNANDLFFHTETRGASVCIIKNDEGKEIPETTIRETATFAASYSSAWKKGWGYAKIFYVEPDQVSKTPKSGEYVTKGSFIINGKKNYIERPDLKLSIGIQFLAMNLDDEYEEISIKEGKIQKVKEDGEEITYFPKLVIAPKNAIKNYTKYYIEIQPSKDKTKTSDLAKMVQNLLVMKVPDELKKWAKMTSLDTIIRLIPPGGGVVVNN